MVREKIQKASRLFEKQEIFACEEERKEYNLAPNMAEKMNILRVILFQVYKAGNSLIHKVNTKRLLRGIRLFSASCVRLEIASSLYIYSLLFLLLLLVIVRFEYYASNTQTSTSRKSSMSMQMPSASAKYIYINTELKKSKYFTEVSK